MDAADAFVDANGAPSLPPSLTGIRRRSLLQLRNIHPTTHHFIYTFLIHSQPRYNKTPSEPRPSCVQVTKMADSSPTDSLITNIPGYVPPLLLAEHATNTARSLLSSGAFSDLTLTCGGKQFKVHKVVLCTQSAVFRKLLDGKFKVGHLRR
jgi:hypothetical protein